MAGGLSTAPESVVPGVPLWEAAPSTRLRRGGEAARSALGELGDLLQRRTRTVMFEKDPCNTDYRHRRGIRR